MAKQRYKRECMLMNYPQSIVFINIRYTFFFYFPKIFCPNFSVKNLSYPQELIKVNSE